MPVPPTSFLYDCSEEALREMLLSSRNKAANVRKVLGHELDVLVEQLVLAEIAEWWLEHRPEVLERTSVIVPPAKVEFFDAQDRRRA